MPGRVLTWRGLDSQRMEFAEAELGPAGLRAKGVQIGVQGVAPGERDGEAVDVPGAYRLDYELATAADLVTERLTATARGEGWERRLDLARDPSGVWSAEDRAFPEVEGALDCDLGLSPLTNFMPVRRHRLTEGGEGVDFVMAWIAVPHLTVHRSEQRYEPIDARTVRYVGKHRSFEGELELDEDGFVVRYPGLAERV